MGLIDTFLKGFGVKEGDYIEVVYDNDKRLRGIIMPKNMFSGDDVLVIKLDNGYNVGLKMERIKEIMKLDLKWPDSKVVLERGRQVYNDLPRVKILAVGGTILSRVDYRTGGVRSAVDPDELLDIIPEIREVCDIDVEIIMNKYSEHLTPSDWEVISNYVYNSYREGYDGIVLLHGTDTMGYTSAALSFSLNKIGVPVVLVGSQRSSDRPSSDAAINLLSALYAAANLRYSGVFLAMHSSTSDDRVAIHLGTRVRKNHTSARFAFESIGIDPVAYVYSGRKLRIEYTYVGDYLGLDTRGSTSVDFNPRFSDRVALMKFYPGMKANLMRRLILDESIDAIIIEGTGLGHVSDVVAEVLKDAISMGKYVFMTSQCIWGRTNLNVYDTGRFLLKYGVIPLEDMLSETAYVKASWVIGNFGSDALSELMPTPIFHDILPKSLAVGRKGCDG